jgi:hypothetical protein
MLSPNSPIVDTASGSPIENGNGENSLSESESNDTAMVFDSSTFPPVADSPKDIETGDSSHRGANVIEECPQDMNSADSTLEDRLGIAGAPPSCNLAAASLPAEENRLAENDNGLPTWLAPMISFLRRVSAERAWQELVTEFVQFEKSGPLVGVSFHFFN